MKARKVKGIDPDGPAADEVAKIVAVRLDELCSFMPKARDPAAVHTLHDMRIAAKRLRYVLELFSGPFGPYAATAAKQVKKLQDVLGEIHDCDVTRPRIAALADDLRAQDARAVRALAPADAKDLDRALAAQAPHRSAYRGLATMDVALAARRDLLFDRFLARWEKLERDGFRARLHEAITSRSHGGNEDPPADDVPSQPPSP
jgi:CHAD domain